MAETPQKCKPSGLSSSQVLLHDPSRNTKLTCISKWTDSPKKIQELELRVLKELGTKHAIYSINFYHATTELTIKLNIHVSISKKEQVIMTSAMAIKWLADKSSWAWVSTDINSTFITSGVSAGQTIPHSVLCSCLGFASLPSLPIGEFRRLRWESVDAKVRRFNTCMQ